MKVYASWDDLKDNRSFTFGEIWLLKDELIRLLPSDRMEDRRRFHYSRAVVIVQNCAENNDSGSEFILIAPLSSGIRFLRRFDVLLVPGQDGVKTECMAQLHLSWATTKCSPGNKTGDTILPKTCGHISAVRSDVLYT